MSVSEWMFLLVPAHHGCPWKNPVKVCIYHLSCFVGELTYCVGKLACQRVDHEPLQRWHSCLYPGQLRLVLDLVTPEGCKAELTLASACVYVIREAVVVPHRITSLRTARSQRMHQPTRCLAGFRTLRILWRYHFYASYIWIWQLTSDCCQKWSDALFIASPKVDQERMKPAGIFPWLGSVFWVLFTAFTLLIRPVKYVCKLLLKVLFRTHGGRKRGTASPRFAWKWPLKSRRSLFLWCLKWSIVSVLVLSDWFFLAFRVRLMCANSVIYGS